MTHNGFVPGLYAITRADWVNEDQLATDVEQAILGGATMIQYRDKRSDQQQRLVAALLLKITCQSYGVPFIINDDVELAHEVDADGVHLGKDDVSIQTARKRLGNHALIGYSCYNKLCLAQNAENAGADYIAFGGFYPSSTKPNVVHASTELLLQAKEVLQLPVVAIGGITDQNGAELVTAGADALAVINGVFGEQDILEAAKRFKQLFTANVQRCA